MTVWWDGLSTVDVHNGHQNDGLETHARTGVVNFGMTPAEHGLYAGA
jgi:hypothetical protein